MVNIADIDVGDIVRVTSGTLVKLPSGRVLTLSGQGLWVSQKDRLLCRVLIEPEDLAGLRELLNKEVRENDRDTKNEGA